MLAPFPLGIPDVNARNTHEQIFSFGGSLRGMSNLSFADSQGLPYLC